LGLKVRVKVYSLRLLRFYQAYCILMVHYCYITGGALLTL